MWNESAGWNALQQSNQLPVANAGADKSVTEGATVTLTGAGSDSDGSIVGYAWTQLSGPAVTINNANTADGSFTAPLVTADTDFVFRLTVTDDDGATATDDIRVTVQDIPPPNQAPVAQAGTDTTIALGQAVTLDGTASSDPDNDSLTYAWTIESAPAGSAATITNANAATASITPDVLGSYAIGLVVNDGTIDSPMDVLTITVQSANVAPIANAGPDQTIQIGASVTLTGSGTDADNDTLTYIWSIQSAPQGSLAQITGATQQSAQFTPDAVGVYVLGLVAHDGTESSTIDTMQLTVNPDSGGIIMPERYFVTPVNIVDVDRTWKIQHDPQNIEFYPVEFDDWLVGETLATVVFTVPPETGLNKDGQVQEIDSTVAAVRLSGGTPGTHTIDVLATSSAGRRINRKVKLIVADV
ncbi:PKD domain-containing protein [Bowmanella denitrificans]|uniref:PKD domain-containing protein n=1 Tax=Bowmanella denitrificans TaxID=366582 RepID=UPI000C9B9053|nr:PKD domain-containing protein [Bowmanella denitrificans]